MITSAILDRLLHHSTTSNIRGKSYRLKDCHKAGLVPRRESATRSMASDSLLPKRAKRRCWAPLGPRPWRPIHEFRNGNFQSELTPDPDWQVVGSTPKLGSTISLQIIRFPTLIRGPFSMLQDGCKLAQIRPDFPAVEVARFANRTRPIERLIGETLPNHGKAS
jgi:IstB-like ATP binding protein